MQLHLEREFKRERMVLWEVTLGTAYFLGLKRTYGLALKIQRRLISPKHPKIRQFVERYVPLFLHLSPISLSLFRLSIGCIDFSLISSECDQVDLISYLQFFAR